MKIICIEEHAIDLEILKAAQPALQREASYIGLQWPAEFCPQAARTPQRPPRRVAAAWASDGGTGVQIPLICMSRTVAATRRGLRQIGGSRIGFCSQSVTAAWPRDGLPAKSDLVIGPLARARGPSYRRVNHEQQRRADPGHQRHGGP